jgi:glycosyltransferase involved in cell wall biosynthesis
MNPKPLFSVVIPLYNKRLYIRRAVDSVLSQSIENFELIVVDDGSTDGGVDLIKYIADSRLRVVYQSNEGAGPARNTGMKTSQGEYIAFLDADDAWSPDHLEELFSLATLFPNAGLIATRVREVSDLKQRESPDLVQNVFVQSNTIRHARTVDYFREAAANIGVVCSSTAAIKREVFYKTGGFENFKAGEDLEYWARVALDYTVAISANTTSIYYRGTGGIMETLERLRPANKIAVAPLKLRDVSPSVAMLCDRSKSGLNIFEHPSIRTYVNGRISLAIPGLIYDGNLAVARNLMRLMLRPLRLKDKFYLLALRMPDFLLSAVALSYKAFRFLYR